MFRKAPGGVFFALLKKSAAHDQVRSIFQKENQKKKQILQKKRQEKKKMMRISKHEAGSKISDKRKDSRPLPMSGSMSEVGGTELEDGEVDRVTSEHERMIRKLNRVADGNEGTKHEVKKESKMVDGDFDMKEVECIKEHDSELEPEQDDAMEAAEMFDRTESLGYSHLLSLD